MLTRFLALMAASLFCLNQAQAVHVILSGGTALLRWENLRIKPDRHDKWWANFIRASTVRIGQIRLQSATAPITWIVYKPAYIARGKADNKPYTQWIEDLGKKYNLKLVWVNSGDEAIAAINNAPRSKSDKIESFYYFGHSNAYAWMLDYSADIMGASTQMIHETDLAKIKPSAFAPNADCWSYGCYTGVSMSGWWKKFVGVPLWGNMESTQYAPITSGHLPKGNGKWVH